MTEGQAGSPEGNGTTLLEGRRVSKAFGGLQALNSVDFQIRQGEIVGLIGPNGSGKTTLFNCISGMLPVDSGQVIFRGETITNQKPFRIARAGLARTFQVLRVYGQMTVMENMLMSQQWQGKSTRHMLRASDQATYERALELLDFVTLSHMQGEVAANLSLGQQRLLELAMALMPDPDIILLDEATAGVNPVRIGEIKDHIRELHARGVTVFLIEHNMDVVFDLCERLYVLHHGELLAEGLPEDIRRDETVIEAYFGH
ncbi:MAG: ABC transporter ATP-binding protein [Anaerolineae bacterium]